MRSQAATLVTAWDLGDGSEIELVTMPKSNWPNARGQDPEPCSAGDRPDRGSHRTSGCVARPRQLPLPYPLPDIEPRP